MSVKKALLVARVSGFVPQHEMDSLGMLRKMGFEVHYATNLNQVVYGRDNSRLQKTGMIVHQIDFCRSPFSRKVRVAQKQLESLMLSEEFDLIHCHMPMSGVLTRRAAEHVRRKTGRFVPVIYTAHGFHFCGTSPLKNWLYYPIERFYARYTDVLVTLNIEDYERALRFPVRGRVYSTGGVAIDLEKMRPYFKENWEVGKWRMSSAERVSAADTSAADISAADSGQHGADGEETKLNIRKKYQLPENGPLLVTVGELAPEKHHLTAIETVALLRDLNASYLICGTGRMEEKLKKKVKSLHLQDRVRFAGYVENVPEVLQQCDCFLFPSTREGLPVAVKEAMAVGLPVIAADVRGCRELLGKAETDCLCKKNSPAEYAAKIRKLFVPQEGETGTECCEQRRQAYGLWSRKEMKRHYSSIYIDIEWDCIYTYAMGG